MNEREVKNFLKFEGRRINIAVTQTRKLLNKVQTSYSELVYWIIKVMKGH